MNPGRRCILRLHFLLGTRLKFYCSPNCQDIVIELLRKGRNLLSTTYTYIVRSFVIVEKQDYWIVSFGCPMIKWVRKWSRYDTKPISWRFRFILNSGRLFTTAFENLARLRSLEMVHNPNKINYLFQFVIYISADLK